MREFPKPPVNNRDLPPNTTINEHIASTRSTPSTNELNKLVYEKPFDIETGCGPQQIENEEVDIILRSTLLSKHYIEPRVIGFIRHYLTCRDVKQAALETGLTTAQGRALLQKADVYSAIQQLTSKAFVKDGIDVGEIIQKVKEIMDVDIAEFQNKDGSYKVSLTDIPPETRRAVKKFKVRNLYGVDENGIQNKIGELIEVELWDKMRSIEMLGREKGLFKQTNIVEHEVGSNMKDLLLGSRERAETAAIEAREVGPEGKKNG